MIEQAEIESQLKSLRGLLTDKGGVFLDTFDEFMEQREFGLALHVVCDFLLQSDAPSLSEDLHVRIHQLHTAMGMDDSRIRELSARKVPPTGTP